MELPKFDTVFSLASSNHLSSLEIIDIPTTSTSRMLLTLFQE